MQNSLFVTIFAIVHIFTTICKKLLTFEISDSTTNFVGGGIPISLAYEIAMPTIRTNSETEFKQNNTKLELVKERIIKFSNHIFKQ